MKKLLNYETNELVKLLFEKGYTKYPISYDGDEWFCYCQMALQWMRKVHNIHIIPYFDKIQPSDLPYSFAVYIVDEYAATREIIACFDIDETLYWSEQEQAIDAALLYVLKNLI